MLTPRSGRGATAVSDEPLDDLALRGRRELDLAHEAGRRGAQQEPQPLAEIRRLHHLLGGDAAARVHSAIGVAVNPGEKIVNWMPAFLVSACADSVSAFTPAFAAA